jgi:hypothetical protein
MIRWIRSSFGGRAARVALLLVAVGYVIGSAPRLAGHVAEAGLARTAAHAICAAPGDPSLPAESGQDENCCCASHAGRRDAPLLFAMLIGIIAVLAPPAGPSAEIVVAAARAARVAEPTTPWLSRGPPSVS